MNTMQFKLTLISAALVMHALAQTISYDGFATTVSCSGTAFGCTDGGAACCSLHTGFGFSAQFNNLPAGSQGKGYTNNGCSNFRFSLFGPGTKCFNSGGGQRATNLNWFHSTQGRRVVQAREAEVTADNCVEPTYFKYADESGVVRKSPPLKDPRKRS